MSIRNPVKCILAIFLVLILTFIITGLNGASTVDAYSSDSVVLSPPCVNGLMVDMNGGASPGSDVTQIIWNWGDGTETISFFVVSHVYETQGTYTITATAYYNDGSSASASTKVSVAPGDLYNDEALTITAGEGGSITYAASVGSGTVLPGNSQTLYLAYADFLSVSAIPNTGYNFGSWAASSKITGFGGSPVATSSSSIYIVVNGASNILANFIPTSTPSSTITTITPSVNPSVSGQSITFTASVSPIPDGGTIQFVDNGTSNLDNPTSLNASGQATYTTSALSVGSHAITAIYSGDANFATSIGTLTQVINILISPTTLPNAIGDTAYPPQTLSASGGTGNYTWKIVPGSGNLPNGFYLNPNTGVISGTTVHACLPSPDTYYFIVQVTDTDNNTGTQPLSITVVCPPFDVNDDGITNISDVVLIGLHWNEADSGPNWISEDVNEDGIVNILDVVIVGLHWNQTW